MFLLRRYFYILTLFLLRYFYILILFYGHLFEKAFSY
jgi:hypothetical protein